MTHPGTPNAEPASSAAASSSEPARCAAGPAGRCCQPGPPITIRGPAGRLSRSLGLGGRRHLGPDEDRGRVDGADRVGQRLPGDPAAELPHVHAPAGQLGVQRVHRQHVLLFLGAGQDDRADRAGGRRQRDDRVQGREQRAGQHVLDRPVPGDGGIAVAEFAQRGDGQLLPGGHDPVPGEGVTEHRAQQRRVEPHGGADQHLGQDHGVRRGMAGRARRLPAWPARRPGPAARRSPPGCAWPAAGSGHPRCTGGARPRCGPTGRSRAGAPRSAGSRRGCRAAGRHHSP